MRVLASLSALLAALVAAGCGSGSDDGGTGRTSLTIVYWEDGDRPETSETWTLTCDPPAGTHPDPEAACARLASVSDSAFEPTPDGTACAEIYGGPQQAEVSGTVGGESLDAAFDRRNGCEIARWDRLEGVLPAVL